jgi:hypothetical protein
MSKRVFNKKQMDKLLQNPNVNKCSEKSISYSKSFKVKAVKEWETGISPKEIFKQAGFDLNVIGPTIPKDSLKRWRQTFREKGEHGLKNDKRGKSKNGGRKNLKWKNDKEKIKYLEAEVDYLKAENDFLVKLRKKS